MGPAGESLAADEETVRLLSEHHAKKGSSVNAARMRMATLPTNSEVSHLTRANDVDGKENYVWGVPKPRLHSFQRV